MRHDVVQRGHLAIPIATTSSAAFADYVSGDTDSFLAWVASYGESLVSRVGGCSRLLSGKKSTKSRVRWSASKSLSKASAATPIHCERSQGRGTVVLADVLSAREAKAHYAAHQTWRCGSWRHRAPPG